MNKKILIGLGSILILAIFLVSLVSAALSDLVYYVGQEQSGKLTAQNPEAQKALEMYNVIQSGNYMGLAQNQICQEESAKEMCGMMAQFQQYSSYTGILNNPSSYFQGMMQQQVCKDNANACSTYSQIMQTQAQASAPLETAKSYATQMAMQQMQGVMPKEVSTIYSYKKYLDVFQMQPKKATTTTSAMGKDPLEGIEGDVDNFADEDFETSKNQIDRGHENECRLAFNLDGTFGDVYDCETGLPEERAGWEGYDLSMILGQEPGMLLVGTKCHLERQGSGLTITTDDANGKPATCFIIYKDNKFENLIGGEVKKGPNGKKIQSGIFKFDDEGSLIYAEFQVSEDMEFIFTDKKYKLQEGTTVIIQDNDVKFGFDYVKNQQVELFSMKNGQWLSSGLVVPTIVPPAKVITPVTVKSLQDGRYLVTGNFEIKGNIEDIQIGPKSIASINGIEMRTTENQLRYTQCKENIKGDWLNFCKRGKDNDFYATGNGFAFKENIPKGRYYYLKGGETSVRLNEVSPNKYRRTAFVKGNVVAPESNLYIELHNKILTTNIPYQTEMMGFSEDISEEVKKSGSSVWQPLEGISSPVPDTLKGGYLEQENDNVVSSRTVFEDANVMSFSQDDGACLVKLEEGNAITAAAITDITGHGIEEHEARINALNNPSPACNQPGETKIKAPTSASNVVVELKGWIFKNLYINNVEVTNIIFSDYRNKVILKADKSYLADPWSADLFLPPYVVPITVLNSEVMDYIKGEIEDDEDYIAANEQMTNPTAGTALSTGEYVTGRIYVVNEGTGLTEDWSFSRTIQGAWGGCKPLRDDSPRCPTDIFVKCVDESEREFLSSVEDGCPADSQTYSKWLRLQRLNPK